MNPDGSLSRFENGAAGKLLVGVSENQLPLWKTLTEAGVAASDHNHDDTYVPLNGDSEITGTVTATGFVGSLTGTATSVSNALSIQLGSGTPATYDGSAAVSIQITPSAIGAKPNFSWPQAGLMTSGGTNQTPGSIAWPSGENSDGAYLLVHYKSGSFVDSWDKFAGLSSGPGILHWTGTATGATLNLLQGSNNGEVLTKTSNGYEFAPISAAIVPAITELECEPDNSHDTGTNRNQKVLFRGTNYNDPPHWEFITHSDIYGATSGVPSVLISEGTGSVGTNNCSGNWVPTDTLSSTPQILAALSGANNGLRFYNPSALGLVTSIPTIKGLQVGEASTAGKVLTGNASATGNPSWSDISNILPAITGMQSGTNSATTKVLTGGNGSTATPNWKSLADAGIAPTSHASTTTTYGAASATSYGHAKATTTTPKSDTESGSLGSEVDSFARGDHAHPTPLVVEFAKRFSVIHGIGLTGAVTAEVTEYVGDSDAIIRVTAIDPDFITNAVPVSKGGTGATSASAALTNLGAAAASHKHALSDINSGLTKGGLLVGSSTTAISSIAPVATGKILASKGTNTLPAWVTPADLGLSTRIKDVIEVHDGADGLDSSYHLVSVTAGHDTEVFVIAGANVSSSTSAYNPQIMLQAPTVDSGGDRIEISFISMAPASVTSALLINFNDAARAVFFKNNIVTTVQQHGGALTIAKGEKLVLNAIHYPTASDNLFWFATKQALSNI